MAIPKLTHERLLEAFHYSVITGHFYWKIRTARRLKPGQRAGGFNALGYVQIQIDKENLLGHRLAFFYLHGRWPEATIDHVDRNKSNNAWLNLREATYTQQNQNALKTKQGVFSSKGGKPWSKIVVNGTPIPLGTFDTEEEAHEAYKAASLKYFGEFSPYYSGASK